MYRMIERVVVSPVANKRFRTYINGSPYDFGFKEGSTYIDHKDKQKRENYIKRHLANPIEKKLIENLVPSPALLSAYLLWSYGNVRNTSIQENINQLNKL